MQISTNMQQLRVFGSYTAVKEYLIIRAINVQEAISRHGVYQNPVGDIALVLFMLMSTDSDDCFATSIITEEDLQRWHVHKDEAIATALENTREKYPPQLCSPTAENESRSIELTDAITKEACGTMLPGVQMLSVAGNPNGSTAIFYPHAMENLYKLMGGKYKFVFMNTTDVMVTEPDCPFLDNMVRLASRQNEYGRPLSLKVYEYDGKNASVVSD